MDLLNFKMIIPTKLDYPIFYIMIKDILSERYGGKNEIIEKLLNGEIKLHEIDKYTESISEAVDIRRNFMEEI